MRSVRFSLLYHMRKNELQGVAVARRKRMQGIRRKLGRIKLNLNQLQDLAGCRAILPSITDINVLVDVLRQSRHELRAENDYINGPKKRRI
jgi:ppGpp synthetase/RelA/SpoT-type nucleotidyltranferase